MKSELPTNQTKHMSPFSNTDESKGCVSRMSKLNITSVRLLRWRPNGTSGRGNTRRHRRSTRLPKMRSTRSRRKLERCSLVSYFGSRLGEIRWPRGEDDDGRRSSDTSRCVSAVVLLSKLNTYMAVLRI